MKDIRVLLAFHTDELTEGIKSDLSVLKRLKFSESKDGTDALFKLANSTHHILIVEENLEKRSGIQVVDWVLKKGGPFHHMGLILISDLELPDHFRDASATGRLQVLSSSFGPSQLKLAFVHAFNYFSGSTIRNFRIRMLSIGDTLIREGEKADSVYLLQRGKLQAVQRSNEGHKILGDIFPGEFVGEMAYINREMRSATVVAHEDSELVEIPIQFVDQILFQKPSWAKALMKTLSKRLKLSNLRVP